MLAHLEEPSRTSVVLILLTGTQTGEVLALRWGKIDWNNRTILVDEGVYNGEVSTPKTASGVRSLPMSELLVAQLRRLRDENGSHPDQLVFLNDVGTTYCRSPSPESSTTTPQLDHFDPKNVDSSVDPCNDSYKYSCNRWIAANPVPPEAAGKEVSR